ncbi:MAG: phage tail protein [Cyclobacteriaceae bacterium]
MPQFPHLKHHFGVYFLFPQFNFNANFTSVSGLNFGYNPVVMAEGGISGYSHSLTDRGSYGTLELKRGLSSDLGLYEWCEGTVNTLKTQPCNVLVSLLDEKSMPVRNWLIFHAIPVKWSADGLDVSSSEVLMEDISLSYQNFILI